MNTDADTSDINSMGNVGDTSNMNNCNCSSSSKINGTRLNKRDAKRE